jgi:hypothetical protein
MAKSKRSRRHTTAEQKAEILKVRQLAGARNEAV